MSLFMCVCVYLFSQIIQYLNRECNMVKIVFFSIIHIADISYVNNDKFKILIRARVKFLI